MKRWICLTALCLVSSINLAQPAVKEFANECVTELKRCENSIAAHREQIERYDTYKQTCQQELELRGDAHQLLKQAVDTCKQTVEIREQQINSFNNITSNLNQHTAQCMAGYTAVMKDYKNCVETGSGFSMGAGKVFWIGLVLGVLLGVPIDI